jgi:hypothetical protein
MNDLRSSNMALFMSLSLSYLQRSLSFVSRYRYLYISCVLMLSPAAAFRNRIHFNCTLCNNL